MFVSGCGSSVECPWLRHWTQNCSCRGLACLVHEWDERMMMVPQCSSLCYQCECGENGFNHFPSASFCRRVLSPRPQSRVLNAPVPVHLCSSLFVHIWVKLHINKGIFDPLLSDKALLGESPWSQTRALRATRTQRNFDHLLKLGGQRAAVFKGDVMLELLVVVTTIGAVQFVA